MFPYVAPEQLRPVSHFDHRYSNPHYGPYRPPSASGPRYPSPRDLTHQPIHQLAQQYACPRPQMTSYSSFGQSVGQTDPPPVPAEHMLRRKTPNGTLAAGYDGSPVEWASASHTVKHILLPASHGPSQRWIPHAHDAQQAPSVSIQHSRSTPTSQYSQASNQWAAGMGTYNATTPNNVAREKDGYAWPYRPQYTPGIDSVLNQVPMHQSSLHVLPDGAQVPTVLQPLHQSSLGPTASNDRAPFGPYWPDGAFIPYRPAALRDTRFHSPAGHHDTRHNVGGSIGNYGSWHPSYPSQTPANPGAHGGMYSSGSFAVANPAVPGEDLSVGIRHEQHHLPDPSYYPQETSSARRFTVIGPNGRFQDGRHPLYAPSQTSRLGIVTSSLETQARGTHFYDTATNDKTASKDVTDPACADTRERVFSYAHTIYVDLLASLHRSQREVNASRQAAGQPHSHRTGIYPRPPRQPGASFTMAHDEGQKYDRRKTNLDQADVGRHGGDGDRTNNEPSHARSVQARPNQDQYSQQLTPSKPAELGRRSSDFGRHPQNPPPLENSSGEPYPRLRRSSGTTISSISPPNNDNESKLMLNAFSALANLSGLCRDSQWQWIDGILLAGCLAYGLGDHTTALGMYQRILDMDPDHVEATSNLAATLLSLGRREEAERYWLRSVKLRPSYFEAVEHLIGLLCGDQRSKEAVNIIDFVERSLRLGPRGGAFASTEQNSETGSVTSRSSSASSVYTPNSAERPAFDYDSEATGTARRETIDQGAASQPGFGSSGYMIPASENGRMLALVHAKGNMLYTLNDNIGAARAFEDAVLIAAGQRSRGIQGLINRIATIMSGDEPLPPNRQRTKPVNDPVLLPPDMALKTAEMVFPSHGELPGLAEVPKGLAKRAAVSTTSNSLLSLAKIFQDGMSSGATGGPRAASGVRDILALYYLSLALQQSPSTANNVGILLAGIQQTPQARMALKPSSEVPTIPGVVPGSGIALALAYYNYGLNIDKKHAHLYTNLGSLLKDIGQLAAAIKMYEQAVNCDGTFDIALANLANAVKDQGKITEAIGYYKRAVAANPDFAEAVCGLVNALNSVCDWRGRGGVVDDGGSRDRWHVDESDGLHDARSPGAVSTGWTKRVVEIVEKQLDDGKDWGKDVLQPERFEKLLPQLEMADCGAKWSDKDRLRIVSAIKGWSGKKWEGARVVRLVERATRMILWRWHNDRFVKKVDRPVDIYARPQLPSSLFVPAAPTVLPFHTFTSPLSAKQIRLISQRNALRISCSTLRAPWLPRNVYPPPPPPAPYLNVGYVSSDFNNHPLAHLMQSVFGLHNPSRVKAYCYATTASDSSSHRQQIEREAPMFHDASNWSAERLTSQIVNDGIHILINLNGYTRGARNEIFAARPAPIQMAFMGFAGTLGAEWCDYLLADSSAVPPSTLRPHRRNIDLWDQFTDDTYGGDKDDWVYSENIIYARDTFFCCDHRQSAPDAQQKQLSWDEEQSKRWEMRRELFPDLADDAVIMGNFNQLYKIEPTTFRSWLRILARVPNAVLWLLRFPDVGEGNLRRAALRWAGPEVAARILFLDVAPKNQHISRARVCDLFLDTPECNAHTTAADVLWSGTPLLTLPRYEYKMCSRMASSILRGALPKTPDGERAARDLIAQDEREYEDRAVRLASEMQYPRGDAEGRPPGHARGRLMDLRRLLYESRWTSALFDTKRWVRDLEEAYGIAWQRWVRGEGGDIWL